MLTWQCEEVTTPAGPTRTHMGAYVARRAKEANWLIGPMGIVDPSIE